MPTIIYSLNLVPTQGEMRDLIAEVTDLSMNQEYP